MRESIIEKYLVLRVKSMGGQVRKVKWLGHRGAPDRLVMLPKKVTPSWTSDTPVNGRYWGHAHTTPAQTIWVELKATGEKPEPHQVREHERMRAMDQRVEIVDSIEGVDALLGI